MSLARHAGLFIAVLVVILLPSVTQASSLTEEPFGLRLTMALDRGAAFTDITGLAASVAYPYASSQNPAGGDFLREGVNAFRFAGTLTGLHVALAKGSSLHAIAPSATIRFEHAGTLIVEYAHFESHDLLSHQGDAFGLEGDRLGLWYSQRVSSAIVVGGRVDFLQSTVRAKSTVADFPIDTRTESLGIEFAVGMLASLTEHWLLGLSGGAGWTRNSNRGTIDFPPPPFAFGPERFSFDDNTRSLNFRGGIAWRPIDAFGAYTELQYLHARTVSHAAGDNGADVFRGRFGVEWLPRPFVALRAGLTVDSDRQVSPSAGVGLYPVKYFQAEFAYVYNAFPEVRKEFGRGHLVSASVSLVF
jgi:hypothetical protein